MSTLRVDNIKSRTGSTVLIPDSNSVSVSGSATVSGNAYISGVATVGGRVNVLGALDVSGGGNFNTTGIITAGSLNITNQTTYTNLTVTNNASVGGALTVSGNLIVAGSIVENSRTSDQIMEIGAGRTGTASGDAGIIVERGDDINAFFGYDESDDQFVFKYTTATGISSGNLTYSSDIPVGIGTLTADRLFTREILEKANISNTTLTGTINLDLDTNTVYYFTSNASANWTFNFRASSTTSLNSVMSIGDSITCTILSTQGGTAYYNNGWQVDGSSVTPKWLGGFGAPSSGRVNSVDYYSFTIFKTANATFSVFANQSVYN